MKEFHCLKCGKPHNSEARFCFFCKTDLEEAILEYKEKHLPIKFENNNIRKLTEEELDEIRSRKVMIPEKKKIIDFMAKDDDETPCLKFLERIASFFCFCDVPDEWVEE